MTWTASLHADVDALGEDAERAERKVADALREIVDGLAAAGHTGIGGTFHGSHSAPVNLAVPGEAPEGAPVLTIAPDPVAALGTGEVSREDVAEAAGVEPGTPVPLAPGQALAPEAPDTAPEPRGDAQQPPSGAEASDTAPDTSEAS